MRTVLRSFGHNHHTYYQIAGVYALLEDAEQAMSWLERAANTGFPCWTFFRIDPSLWRRCPDSKGNQPGNGISFHQD
jgi:hypothetical protein